MQMSTKEFNIQLNTGMINKSVHSLPKLQGSTSLGSSCYKLFGSHKSVIDKKVH